MRNVLVAALLTGCAPAMITPRPLPPPHDRAEVARVLDQFHDAAARADEARLLAQLADDAVFLGTDAKERWSKGELRDYAHSRFASGRGWVFHVTRRAITLAGDHAWFDEDIQGEKLGPARGSGVLVFSPSIHSPASEGRWRIVQYNLVITTPNEQFASVRALLDPGDLRARHKAAYAEATRVARTDPAAAIALLSPFVAEAKTRPGDDLELWLHNQLTWLRWSLGDLAGALAEVEQARITLEHGTLPADKVRALRLHQLWDRAYLLLERGDHEAARAAKREYDALATEANDKDGMAVLEAFFQVGAKSGAAALAAAKRVDHTDLQDLYVIALAYDGARDPDGAKRVRARICDGHEYLMKPLIIRRMQRDNTPCP